MIDTQRLTVDGEVFDVRQRDGRPGTYDFTWVSGPNEGYGFSSFGHTSTEVAWMPDAIRNFLAQIDPKTGYLG